MQPEHIEAQCRAIAADHLGRAPEQITREARFQPRKGESYEAEDQGHLGCDSLDVIELAMAYEDEFSVELPDDEIEGLVTFGDAVDLIGAKLARKAA